MAATVFVISPIGAPGSDVQRRANQALKYIFRKALPRPDWNVQRADEGRLSDSIGHHVIRSIVEADLIIADLTGHNPNVFYELAVAHGFQKPVVHLISRDESLPFDVFDQRTIHYDITDLESVEDAVNKVREYATEALTAGQDPVNPLTNYAAFHSIRSSGQTEVAETGTAIADMLEQVLGRLSQLEKVVRTRLFPGPPSDLYGIRTTEDGGVEIRPPTARGYANASPAEVLDAVLKERKPREKTSE
ncbi:MAG: hypothetical protein JWN41_1732 [Thermoleophilia bacterium]|nr:hypothetical protein [Thermoleophilia bacterium]